MSFLWTSEKTKIARFRFWLYCLHLEWHEKMFLKLSVSFLVCNDLIESNFQCDVSSIEIHRQYFIFKYGSVYVFIDFRTHSITNSSIYYGTCISRRFLSKTKKNMKRVNFSFLWIFWKQLIRRSFCYIFK